MCVSYIEPIPLPLTDSCNVESEQTFFHFQNERGIIACFMLGSFEMHVFVFIIHVQYIKETWLKHWCRDVIWCHIDPDANRYMYVM